MRKDYYSEYYEIENVHWWFTARWHIFVSLIEREFRSRSKEIRSLDVGCGTGTMLGHLDRLGMAFGVDISPEALAFCRRRGQSRVLRSCAASLPFGGDYFDLVCALDMLEHVADDVAALREFGRICSPNGRILITVPAYSFLWGAQDEISHHLRRYSKRQLESRIHEAGLVVRQLTYFNTLLFPLIALIRLSRRLVPALARGELHSDFEMTPPGWLNNALGTIFSAESMAIEHLFMPFGVSVLAVASGPSADCSEPDEG
jgi:SAM-dependent methyltransferase